MRAQGCWKGLKTYSNYDRGKFTSSVFGAIVFSAGIGYGVRGIIKESKRFIAQRKNKAGMQGEQIDQVAQDVKENVQK